MLYMYQRFIIHSLKRSYKSKRNNHHFKVDRKEVLKLNHILWRKKV